MLRPTLEENASISRAFRNGASEIEVLYFQAAYSVHVCGWPLLHSPTMWQGVRKEPYFDVRCNIQIGFHHTMPARF